MNRYLKIILILLRARWIGLKHVVRKGLIKPCIDKILGERVTKRDTLPYHGKHVEQGSPVFFEWVHTYSERTGYWKLRKEIAEHELRCISNHPDILPFITTKELEPKRAFNDLVAQTLLFNNTMETMERIANRLGELNDR